MASASRAKQFAEVHKVLKKHYKPVRPEAQRPVLDHLLLACCLEEAHYEAAEEAFATLVHTFFDWNEVRVTSIRELTEVMAGLPDSRAAANRVKRVLQNVFEETFSFDLEDHRKKNLGPTVEWLSKIDGVTSFAVAYVVQSTLGGHAIPIDSGTMAVLRLLDLASEEDAQKGTVPGLERAIPKAKGIEFGSLLHQLGADFTANPYSPRVRNILLEIDPGVADRLPKRREAKPARKTMSAGPSGPAEAKPSETPAADEASAKDKAPSKDETGAIEETTAGAKEKAPRASRKRPKGAEKKEAAPSPEDVATPAAASDPPTKKRAASQQLAKRKPR